MLDVFGHTQGSLAVGLMAARDAGEAAGGDKRDMQSAAMLIVKKDGGVWLQVDDGHPAADGAAAPGGVGGKAAETTAPPISRRTGAAQVRE